MNKKLLFIISLLAILLLAACSTNKQTNKDDKISIYTTVYPLQYFAERIGGNDVDVKSIYPPGADEHTFEPTQKDMIALADSDLFFYVGLGLEGFVENAEKTMKGQHVKMVATANTIPEERLEEGHDHDHEEDATQEEHHHEEVDPHVWISPLLSIELASSIKDSLIEVAPEKKAEFEKNYETLRGDLLTLNDKFNEMVTSAPSKTFFVSHAAFGYIASEYGLEQVAIAGLNSQSEPSQKQLATIVKYAKDNDVKYVLFEQNVSSKLTDVVRKEIGAESLMLHNLGILTVADVNNNENYLTIMERNIETLKKALGNK